MNDLIRNKAVREEFKAMIKKAFGLFSLQFVLFVFGIIWQLKDDTNLGFTLSFLCIVSFVATWVYRVREYQKEKAKLDQLL